MKFTNRTYRVAIKRAKNLEYKLFSDHASLFRGPEPWIRQIKVTNLLVERKNRKLR